VNSVPSKSGTRNHLLQPALWGAASLAMPLSWRGNVDGSIGMDGLSLLTAQWGGVALPPHIMSNGHRGVQIAFCQFG
jgi:hypothetical protein